MEFFVWLEHSRAAMAIKESTVFYDLPLVLHGIGMGILVGLSTAVYLRILGFASRLPLGPMEQFFPLMYAGFWTNALSGIVLFGIYPTKALVNPGFYIKMAGVVLAVVYLRRVKRQVFGNPGNLGTAPCSTKDRVLAGTALLIWLVTITAGRLMAYHGVANVEREASIAVFLASVVLLIVGYAGIRLLGASAPLPADAHLHPLAKGR